MRSPTTVIFLALQAQWCFATVPPPTNLSMVVSGIQEFLISWNTPTGYNPGKFSLGLFANSTLDEYSLWMGSSLTTLTLLATQSSLLPDTLEVGTQATNIQIGQRYYIRMISRSCCSPLVSSFFSKACAGLTCTSSATAFSSDSFAYPLNGYATASCVALGYPSAPVSLTVSALADNVTYPSKGETSVQWSPPSNTGSGAQVLGDVIAYLVARSRNATFSESTTVFYGLPALSGDLYSVPDTGLAVGVIYFYRVNAGNLACGG